MISRKNLITEQGNRYIQLGSEQSKAKLDNLFESIMDDSNFLVKELSDRAFDGSIVDELTRPVARSLDRFFAKIYKEDHYSESLSSLAALGSQKDILSQIDKFEEELSLITVYTM